MAHTVPCLIPWCSARLTSNTELAFLWFRNSHCAMVNTSANILLLGGHFLNVLLNNKQARLSYLLSYLHMHLYYSIQFGVRSDSSMLDLSTDQSHCLILAANQSI